MRPAVVAGRFYPGQPAALAREVTELLSTAAVQAASAYAVMVPHAGYAYSGRVAAETLSAVDVPTSVLMLGPNHTGCGARRALWPSGAWSVPVGQVLTDTTLVAELLSTGECEPDCAAHQQEHSLEVQLPLLMALQPKLLQAALCLSQLSLSECLSLGEAIAQVMLARPLGDRPLLLSSSDMSHYVSAEIAAAADHRMLSHVLSIDPEGLYRRVVGDRLSMCGVMPTTVMLAALRKLGATHGRLVRYAHSGEVTGDSSSVVGYAGVVFPAGSC
jgi:AmmeMemoRadiSam system protein B